MPHLRTSTVYSAIIGLSMHWLLMSRGAVNHVHISVPNIRKEMFFEAVSALLGLPSASMFLLGIHECLLCSEILNVETQHSSFDINSSQRFGGLICFHVALISIPLVVYILRIMTLVFTFLKRIWAVLLDKEVVPQKLT